MGLFRDNETNNSKLRIPTVVGEPVGYFTFVAEDFNLGQPRTNPVSSQGGNWTQSLWMTSPTP